MSQPIRKPVLPGIVNFDKSDPAKAEKVADLLLEIYSKGGDERDGTMKIEDVEAVYALALEVFSTTDDEFKKLVAQAIEDSGDLGEISIKHPPAGLAVAVAAKVLCAEHTGDLVWEDLDQAHEWALEARAPLSSGPAV